ncbi:[FeFe] hydrogenase H-cluster radical SAM maturase HydE [Alkalispirochaeta sphaeroplastigenens]|nr:[FeFe] hydrogenase H-cluster radical SAM maturase HydE [Alkalispirochaeta sphaeroplastigenens]
MSDTIMSRKTFSLAELEELLLGHWPGGDAALAARARQVMAEEVGEEVRLRGLLEFSNRCASDCYYCGIRRSSDTDDGGHPLVRFDLTEEAILEGAQLCLQEGYGSMTLQAGERRDRAFIDFVEGVLRKIKEETVTPDLPRGLGITLSVGEQTRETYARFFDAGAHRYLLRVETSDPRLFARLHPPEQTLERRIRALEDLKATGFQVGTGVMIGIPGQTARDLARDILFFRKIDADMIGMGPYIEAAGSARQEMLHRGLLPESSPPERLRLSLRMIAATRLALRDVNIAAATALQALSPTGREQGLAFGANVLMPIVTPGGQRKAYQLYQGKPCVEETARECIACTPRRAAWARRPVSYHSWGDAPHARRKPETASGTPPPARSGTTGATKAFAERSPS